MSTVKAIQTRKDPVYESRLITLDKQKVGHGDVVIRVQYSSINYKDALAITGKGRILKSFPLIPGIDASGVVESSTSPDFSEGQKVLVTGCGLGETQDGGYCEIIRVPSEWVVPLPENLTLQEAMILGTAGFTTGLCLSRMLQMDQKPEMGPIAITGASGGVGSIATQIFSQIGFDVIAVSGKTDRHQQLLDWGAKEVVTPEELHLGTRPLETGRFGGALDNVGGELLAGLCRHTNLWGNIACVGLAGSHELNTTVMPLILRGVSLLGVSSNNCPMGLRKHVWNKLATEWKPKNLQQIVSQTVALEDIPKACSEMIERKTMGRILVHFSS